MLHSELHRLETLVTELIGTLKQAVTAVLPDKLSEIGHQVGLECQRIKQQGMHSLFSNQKDPGLYRYVRFHQSGITLLSDQLSEYLIIGEKNTESMNLLETVLRYLDQLLYFFQRSLGAFFDAELVVTRFRADQDQIAYRNLVKDLQNVVLHRMPNSSLGYTVLNAIEEQLSGFTDGQLTYRESSVVCQLIISLRYYVSGMALIDEKGLFNFLYRMNLNSLILTGWFRKQLDQPGFYTFQEARDLFSEKRKPSKFSFDPRERSIQELIMSCLRERAEATGSGSESTFAKEHMPLTLSVTQFSLFIRVCYKAGCFSIHNAAEIIRFFATRFSTKRQDDISIKSFTKGFYATDQMAAAMVRDMLQRMIVFIDKTYFP